MITPQFQERENKCWGTTQKIFEFNSISCHHLKVNKGTYCSIHQHQFKFNRFYVLSGLITVQIWRLEQSVEEYYLARHRALDVEPGIDHRFIVQKTGEVLEFYWSLMEDEDIVRTIIGGTGDPPQHPFKA
jgi:hypothetical protein